MNKPRTDLRVTAAALLALLVVAPLSAAGHRCIFDELQRSRLAVGSSAVAGAGRRHAQPHESTADTPWEPIRIAVFTEDFDNRSRHCTEPGQQRPNFLGSTLKCNDSDVLTYEKKRLLRDSIIPDAVQMHKDRLLVHPLNSSIVVENITVDMCSSLIVPQSHRTAGVPNADFVLYIAAAPTTSELFAWAGTCLFDPSGRPLVGFANVSPAHVMDILLLTRVLTHEILHALGFSGFTFFERNMTSYVSVRGKKNVPAITSPRVLEKARAHYGCSTMDYMELEDMGGDLSAGSHWKMRNAKDEMMSPIASSCTYTAITIAAMEDTGYYKGNYSNAESMVWGKSAGCVLFDKKCVVNGTSQVPEMFCDKETCLRKLKVCTASRLGLGWCELSEQGNYSTIFQYFSEPKMGGLYSYMDYCPYVMDFIDSQCRNGVVSRMPGSVVSESARCFSAMPNTSMRMSNGEGAVAVCADVLCDEGTARYRVRVRGAREFVDCPPGDALMPSEHSTEFISGAIECPPYGEVCYWSRTVFSGSGSGIGGRHAGSESGNPSEAQ